MKTFRTTFRLFLLFILTACSTETERTFRSIESRDIAMRSLSANEVIPPQNPVLTTEEDWDERIPDMESVTASITEGFLETDIDFNSYSVLAVFDKTRPHTGYSIRIERIIEKDDHVLVGIKNINGGDGYTALTQPFHLVKIKKTAKPVSFE